MKTNFTLAVLALVLSACTVEGSNPLYPQQPTEIKAEEGATPPDEQPVTNDGLEDNNNGVTDPTFIGDDEDNGVTDVPATPTPEVEEEKSEEPVLPETATPTSSTMRVEYKIEKSELLQSDNFLIFDGSCGGNGEPLVMFTHKVHLLFLMVDASDSIEHSFTIENAEKFSKCALSVQVLHYTGPATAAPDAGVLTVSYPENLNAPAVEMPVCWESNQSKEYSWTPGNSEACPE